MKVYDISLFLVILHIAAAVVGGLALWAVPVDLAPENISEYDPANIEYPGGFDIVGILGPSSFSVVAVIGFMTAGLFVSLFARVPTHQLIGIVLFAAFFMLLTGNTATVLSGFFVPELLIDMFVALNGIVLLAGIYQIATGVSFEHTV